MRENHANCTNFLGSLRNCAFLSDFLSGVKGRIGEVALPRTSQPCPIRGRLIRFQLNATAQRHHAKHEKTDHHLSHRRRVSCHEPVSSSGRPVAFQVRQTGVLGAFRHQHCRLPSVSRADQSQRGPWSPRRSIQNVLIRR